MFVCWGMGVQEVFRVSCWGTIVAWIKIMTCRATATGDECRFSLRYSVRVSCVSPRRSAHHPALITVEVDAPLGTQPFASERRHKS